VSIVDIVFVYLWKNIARHSVRTPRPAFQIFVCAFPSIFIVNVCQMRCH